MMVAILISAVLIGVLMAIRYELSSVWARAAAAGGAFAILGCARAFISRRLL
jgi:hypothetical protein